MSEYIITDDQVREINKAYSGMKTVTSWLSCYTICDTSAFPPTVKSEHVAITLPEIIRCHDCEHYCKNDLCKEGNEFDQELWRLVEPDGFCAWGERRGK